MKLKSKISIALVFVFMTMTLSACFGSSTVMMVSHHEFPVFAYRPSIDETEIVTMVGNRFDNAEPAVFTTEERAMLTDWFEEGPYSILAIDYENPINVEAALKLMESKIFESAGSEDISSSELSNDEKSFILDALRTQLEKDNEIAQALKLQLIPEYSYDIDNVIRSANSIYIPVMTTLYIQSASMDDSEPFIDPLIKDMETAIISMGGTEDDLVASEFDRDEIKNYLESKFAFFRNHVGEYLLIDYSYREVDLSNKEHLVNLPIFQLAATGTVYTNDGNFTDPNFGTPSPWAVGDIYNVIKEGIVPISIGEDWQRSITREEFVTLLVRAFEADARISGLDHAFETDISFTDTESRYAGLAAEYGWVNGVGDGKFAPNDLLTREQAATICMNVHIERGLPVDSMLSLYDDDAEISEWAVVGVYNSRTHGYMLGYGQGGFDPKGNLTVEQAVTLITRLVAANPMNDQVYPPEPLEYSADLPE